MLCQRCHEREALVHLTSVCRRLPFDDASPTLEVTKQHYCGTCAADMGLDKGRLPLTPRGPTPRDLFERVLIIRTTPEQVFVRSLREAETEWHVQANLIPPRLRKEGTELTIVGTPEEIAWVLKRD